MPDPVFDPDAPYGVIECDPQGREFEQGGNYFKADHSYWTDDGSCAIKYFEARSNHGRGPVELIAVSTSTGGGAAAFTDLDDTPNTMGSAGQVVRVNDAETAFEYADLFAFTDASGTPGDATINTPRGRVKPTNSTLLLVVTNSLCSANSTVLLSASVPDGAAPFNCSARPGDGSFTIVFPDYPNAYSGNLKIDFLVLG